MQSAISKAFVQPSFDRTDFQAAWCFSILIVQDCYFLPTELKASAGEYPFFSVREGTHPTVVFADACWKNGIKLKHFDHEAAQARGACEVDIDKFWEGLCQDYLLTKFSVKLSRNYCRITCEKSGCKVIAPWFGALTRQDGMFKKTERSKANVGLLISKG